MKWKLTSLFIILICWNPNVLAATTLEDGINDPILRKAWELVKTGHPTESLQKISGYQPNLETKVYYHFIYGRALERAQKPLEAIEHYRSAYFDAPPGELKELALLERANGYCRIGNYYEAKLTYSLFLTSYPHTKHLEKANMGMAQSLVAIGQLPKALQYYEKAGDGLEAIFGRANILHRLGRVKEAHEFYLKGISRDKVFFLNSEELIFYYGENLQQMGKDQEALPYLSAEIKSPVFKKKADLALGLIAMKTGKMDEAKKYYNSALTSSDRQTKQEALFHLAETQMGAGRKNEARQGFQEYLLKYPTGKAAEEILLKLARMDMEDAQFEKASKWIVKLVLGFPSKKEVLSEMEGFLLKMKDKDPVQMVSLWKAAGKKLLDVSREPFLLVMSEALKGTGKPFFELHQWLATNGSEKVKIRSLIALTKYRVETGNLDSALAGLKFLKNSKGKVSEDEILRLEAHILHSQGDYGPACERLLSLKKIIPQDLPLLEDTLTSAKDINKALEFYEKNLLHLGGNSNNYIKIADLFFEKGKKKEALQYYQKALEKDPLNEWGLFRAGSLMDGEEAQKMLGRIKTGNSLLGKLARISLKEKEVQRKIGETF
jgi:tetratricopeptide (TPR) repeat protein